MPDLPAHFLPRPEDLTPLKALVLTEGQEPVAVTGVSHRVGLHGMGGIGKSVLAAALARDDDIRGTFPDGVIWLTLGQDPAIIERQVQLANTLSDRPVSFTDEQQGKSRLSELLSDAACLIILDDVWQMAHIRAFEALGPKCCLLITTRDLELITALGAREHRLDVLRDSQPLELLALWADQDVSALPDEARLVAQECGYLPLALAMVGAMVRGRPELWENALYRLCHADLAKIHQQFLDYPYPDLLRAIQISVEALKVEDQKRYLDLAVFPEDTAIAEAVLHTYWQSEGLDIYDVQDVVNHLVDRSLLRRDEEGLLTLHDLQYDYVRKQVDDLAAYHHRLLQAYAEKSPEGWPTAPDDGYLYRHLAYHLLASDQKGALCSLLTDSPAWMEAKFHTFQSDWSYAADLDLIISTFVRCDTVGELLQLVSLGAARQAVNHRVNLYGDQGLRTLVLLNRSVEALSHARLLPSPTDRFRGLIQIYTTQREQGQAEQELLTEALEVAYSIENASRQADALGQVAAALAQAGGEDEANAIFNEALEMAYSIEDASRQADALGQVAAALAQASHVDQALEVVHSIEDASRRADALGQVAAALAQAGGGDEANAIFNEALDVARSIEDDNHRAYGLGQVAAALAQAGHVDQALEVACSIENANDRVYGLGQVATALAQTGRGDEAYTILTEVLDVARPIEDDKHRAYALAHVATALAQAGDVDQALEVARSIESVDIRAHVLGQVAALLAQEGRRNEAHTILTEALEVTRPIEDAYSRADVRRQVAALLVRAGHIDQALEVARSIESADSRADALEQVATALAQAGHVDQALEAAHSIKDAYSRAYTLAHVVTALACHRLCERVLQPLGWKCERQTGG